LSAAATSSAAAQTAAPAETRIDVHHRYVPPVHAAAMAGSRAGGVPKWTAQLSLDDLDRAGVATESLSLVPPDVWFGDAEAARKLARKRNDYVDAAARRLSCRARCTAQQSGHTFAR
jgi:6-methylsalicylate decarboxylase